MARIIVDEKVCKGCGMCVHACPLAKGYHPAQLVEPEKCVGCASCATMCPDTAITVER